MANQSQSKKKSRRTVGTHKCEEAPVFTLPGCKVYSIRMRPRNFPKDDVNYEDWNIVGYNIEKVYRPCYSASSTAMVHLSAAGTTLNDAIDAMQTILNLAKEYKINTFNGVPGSGLGKGKHDIPDQTEIDYTISEKPFYKANISVGPWKSKGSKKSKGGHNNNCGRHQAKQEMRRILVSIELIQIKHIKENEESRG